MNLAWKKLGSSNSAIFKELVMIDSWPLAVQWAVLITIAVAFYGVTWWQARTEARARGDEPQGFRGHVRMMTKTFRLSDWAMTLLLAVFLIPLGIKTLAGLGA